MVSGGCGEGMSRLSHPAANLNRSLQASLVAAEPPRALRIQDTVTATTRGEGPTCHCGVGRLPPGPGGGQAGLIQFGSGVRQA